MGQDQDNDKDDLTPLSINAFEEKGNEKNNLDTSTEVPPENQDFPSLENFGENFGDDVSEKVDNFNKEIAPEQALDPFSEEPIDSMEPVKEVVSQEDQSLSETSELIFEPFHLSIIGKLEINLKDRLFSLLAQEKIGIREMDLEGQWENGKIFIPRMTEYAGVILVNAMKYTSCQMLLTPVQDEEKVLEKNNPFVISPKKENHPAEKIDIFINNEFKNHPEYEFVGIIYSTSYVKIAHIENKNSLEYLKNLESLKRELKYKAYFKNIDVICNFQVTVHQLFSPHAYRMLVLGEGMRKKKSL
jgi:hypothetical protein